MRLLMPKAVQRGFTLMELIITMVIIAILTAVAIPNYTAYVIRSNRAEARGQLLEISTWMERWRTERGRYDDPGAPNNPPPTPPFPTTYAQSPPTGVAKYTIAVAANPTAYTVTATPAGVMAGDVCGNLSVNQSGQRLFSGGGGTQEICWNR
ncbi:MAG: type IV pilin protein [Burkholderiaceae bacterium]